MGLCCGVVLLVKQFFKLLDLVSLPHACEEAVHDLFYLLLADFELLLALIQFGFVQSAEEFLASADFMPQIVLLSLLPLIRLSMVIVAECRDLQLFQVLKLLLLSLVLLLVSQYHGIPNGDLFFVAHWALRGTHVVVNCCVIGWHVAY